MFLALTQSSMLSFWEPSSKISHWFVVINDSMSKGSKRVSKDSLVSYVCDIV